MKKYQYKVFWSTHPLSVEELNTYGNDGWELCSELERDPSYRSGGNNWRYIFKQERI